MEIGQAAIQHLFLSWKAQQKVSKKGHSLFFRKMALTEGGSFLVSSILSLLIFSAMQVVNCNNVGRWKFCSGNIFVAQVYKGFLASSQLMTIATGFTGSLLFVFLITAGAIFSLMSPTSTSIQPVGNLEKTVFGNNFQTKFGEVRSVYIDKHFNVLKFKLTLLFFLCA